MKHASLAVAGCILLSMVVSSCAGHRAGVGPQAPTEPTPQPTNAFAIYLTDERATNGLAIDWSRIKLRSSPVIADADIVAVDLTNRWRGHWWQVHRSDRWRKHW